MNFPFHNFASSLNHLQQRTWLMHWSFFVFFNHDDGRNGILDLFLSDLNVGYDGAKAEFVDMVKAGIIDQVKVIRTILVDAASVSSMTTTEAIVADCKQADDKEMMAGMGVMGGMGGMGGMY